MRRFLFVVSLLGLSACGGGGGGGGASAGPGPAPTGPSQTGNPSKPFVDATAETNIDYRVSFTAPYLLDPELDRQMDAMTFGGAAVGDCDADGDTDLFITYGDGGPNRLYLNELNGGSGTPLQFRDTAAEAGVAYTDTAEGHNDRHSGPIFADMDGDGDLDLFVGAIYSDPSKLYENRGDCTFVDVTVGSGIDSIAADHTVSAAFGDYDLDGDLDLFLAHWGSGNEIPPGGSSDHLFRNVSNENGLDGIRFENVSAASGITRHLLAVRSYGSGDGTLDLTLTPTLARINDDVWPDITLAADFGTAQVLINDVAAPGTFIDATNNAVRRVDFGMGSALGDIDFDGDLDWFVTSIFREPDPNTPTSTGNYLYRNPGGDFSSSRFESIANAGVADGGWAWGACFLDIDNDTDLDIYHTNGWYEVEVSRVFVAGGEGAYLDQAHTLGLDEPKDGRGVVCDDFDNDGDIDILHLTNEPGNSAIVYRNDRAAAGNNYLRVRLVGIPPNTAAAGARIFVTIGGRTQMREIMIGGNYLSQTPTVQVFGLGNAVSVDELRVEWPALLPGPAQPPELVRRNVPAGTPGATLVLCHPELLPAPDDCSSG